MFSFTCLWQLPSLSPVCRQKPAKWVEPVLSGSLWPFWPPRPTFSPLSGVWIARRAKLTFFPIVPHLWVSSATKWLLPKQSSSQVPFGTRGEVEWLTQGPPDYDQICLNLAFFICSGGEQTRGRPPQQSSTLITKKNPLFYLSWHDLKHFSVVGRLVPNWIILQVLWPLPSTAHNLTFIRNVVVRENPWIWKTKEWEKWGQCLGI